MTTVLAQQGRSGGSYVHSQALAAAAWVIVHALGYRPGGIVCIDQLGNEVEGAVTYPDDQTIRVDFNGLVAGTAYVS